MKYNEYKSFWSPLLTFKSLVNAGLMALLLLGFQTGFAQKKKAKKASILTANLVGTYQNTAGDLADRFGGITGYGLGVDYITGNNWIVGTEGNVYFGSLVREDVLAPIRNSSDFIVGNNGSISNIGLRMRGWSVGGRIGKLIPFGSRKKRMGIRITAGAGYLQHRIRIQDDPEAPVAGLSNEYKKGYDRKTDGLNISEFIGYQYFANNRRINFYLGVELNQGITKSVRGYNYDLRMPDTETRLDMSYGIRAGWILPFYIGTDSDAPTTWY